MALMHVVLCNDLTGLLSGANTNIPLKTIIKGSEHYISIEIMKLNV